EQIVKGSLVYSYAITSPFTSVSAAAIPNVEEGKLTHYEESTRFSPARYARSMEEIETTPYSLLKKEAIRGIHSAYEIHIDLDDTIRMKQNLEKEKELALNEIVPLIEQITYGLVSEEVRKVQEVLHTYGYYTGNVDSIY